jgi:mannosyltransferase
MSAAATRTARAGGLLLLMALSVWLLRTDRLGTGYWIDEGLSVGIADRPLLDIPGVLRLDGSPPAYYMLLHVWVALTGSAGPTSTHWLSVLIATAAIPVTWALVRSQLGVRAGWIAAVLVAGVPFLTQYAQESRMYALVVFLCLIACTCFAGGFVLTRTRRWVVGYAVAQAALLYTHNWGWFLGVGLTVAWLVLVLSARGAARRALVRDGLLAAAVIAVLLAPWLPTLAFQVGHTGAPWANPPGIDNLYLAPQRLLGTTATYLLLLGAGAGIVALRRARPARADAELRTALVLAVTVVVCLVVPWLISQPNPAWAYRYTAIAVAPLVLLATIGLARARGVGLAVLALVVAAWLGSAPAPPAKSNVSDVTRAVRPALVPGDLVVSTQPEQIPVLHHYWQGVGDLRWATLWGPVSDVGVTDWRDGVTHLEGTSPQRDLAPLLDRVAPGQRVALVQPITVNLDRWRAPWTALVRQRSAAWEAWMHDDPRFRVVAQVPVDPRTRLSNSVAVQLWTRLPIP